MSERVDLFVIGGGINGAAVARDAAGRGLTTMLAERGDYANATSSASSKLIHGGLRYLEHYEFRLVREALRERETLLRIAPHLVEPLRFLLPITADQPRPAWWVRLGLKLYDVLSGRRLLAPTGRLGRAEIARIPHLRRERCRAVLHYPDCFTDDSRLVLETVLDARARGADIRNYCEVVAVRREPGGYRIDVRDADGDHSVEARYVVNAAGPWANAVLARFDRQPSRRGLRLVRGSHIVLPMPEPPLSDAFTLQSRDGRVVFVLPWMERFLIIGTTDVPQEEPPESAACTPEETRYLLDCAEAFLDLGYRPADVIWTWSGVRALADDGRADPSRATRDYKLHVERNGRGGLVTVYGGKITTHRRLAEQVLATLEAMGAQAGPAWTDAAPLHGGGLPRERLAALADEGPADLPRAVKRRWAFTYGSCARDLMDAVARDPSLGVEVAPGVPRAELLHAATVEDARCAEDFLERRTKLNLLLDAPARELVRAWFADRSADAVPQSESEAQWQATASSC